jgi:hypothetical protein
MQVGVKGRGSLWSTLKEIMFDFEGSIPPMDLINIFVGLDNSAILRGWTWRMGLEKDPPLYYSVGLLEH